MSVVNASQNVLTVWCMLVGVQGVLFFGLNMISSLVLSMFSSSFPKCALSFMLRKNDCNSVCSSVSLNLPGVGQKFKFFCNKLKSCILKSFLERLITCPFGSCWYLVVS